MSNGNNELNPQLLQMVSQGDITETEYRTIAKAINLMNRRSALGARLDQIVLRHNASESAEIRKSYVTALENIERQVKGIELRMVHKRKGMLR